MSLTQWCKTMTTCLIACWFTFETIQQWFSMAWIQLVLGRFPELSGTSCSTHRSYNFLKIMGWWFAVIDVFHWVKSVAKTSTLVHYHVPQTTVALFWPCDFNSYPAGRCHCSGRSSSMFNNSRWTVCPQTT